MEEIEAIARRIVAREGGFVDDPDDPGGPTKHGVTLRTLARLGRDLNGDGRIDRADVKAVDEEEAVRIFLRHYYHRPRIDLLPRALRPQVFDMYVNSGANAVRILQRLLRKMGLEVAVDGVIGPQTVGAARRAMAMAPDHLADAYAIERRRWYLALADRNPRLRKYVVTRAGGKGGWIRRAEAFLSPRYRMSEGEFRRRIEAWG